MKVLAKDSSGTKNVVVNKYKRTNCLNQLTGAATLVDIRFAIILCGSDQL